MDLTEMFHTPYEAPTKSYPRHITAHVKMRQAALVTDPDGFRHIGTADEPTWAFACAFGCSDEWLAANPGYLDDIDDDLIRQRMDRDFDPNAYEEGDEIEIHVTLHHFGRGVVAERSYSITGTAIMEEVLDSSECAARAGIGPGTWRGYVSRGQAPAADVPADARLVPWRPRKDAPYWRLSTFNHWLNNRLGAGHRSDLDKDD